jgi:hypothetical protein
MSYDYKKHVSCRQKSGEKGTYATKKKGAKEQKCWKSKTAHDNSKKAQHAGMHELDEGPPSDPGPNPGKASAGKGPKTSYKSSPTSKIRPKSESVLRKIIRQMLLEEHIPSMLEIMPSEIAGMGLFATTTIPAGTALGTAHIKMPDGGYHVTELGHFHNHSYEPNCVNKMDNGTRTLYAAKDIFPYEEITVDYTLQPDLEQPKPGWS